MLEDEGLQALFLATKLRCLMMKMDGPARKSITKMILTDNCPKCGLDGPHPFCDPDVDYYTALAEDQVEGYYADYQVIPGYEDKRDYAAFVVRGVKPLEWWTSRQWQESANG